MLPILVISEEDVKKKLTMSVAIDLMKEMFLQVAAGKTNQPLRTFVSLPEGCAYGNMPCSLTTNQNKTYFGTKLVSLFPKNQDPVPTIQGVIVLFGQEQLGQPIAMIEASSVTAIRTAAASGLATSLLAKSDSTGPLIGCIIGSGVQAISHIEAILNVRKFSSIKIFGRNESKAQKLASQMTLQYSQSYPNTTFVATLTIEEAAQNADVICTVTNSHTPILFNVKPGAHINAVGAHGAAKREIDGQIMKKASVWADLRTSTLAEGGDFLIPIKEGLYKEDHLKGDLVDLVSGKASGRSSDSEITVFNSLGIAIEDLASSIYLYESLSTSDHSNSVRLMSRL